MRIQHNIQQSQIHIFLNRLLGAVVKVLQLFLVFSYSIRIVLEPTLKCVRKLRLLEIWCKSKYEITMDSRYEGKQSNSTRNMKHVNFVPKDVQRILSSRKSILNRKCCTRKLFLKILQYSQEDTWNLLFNKNTGLQGPSFIKKRLQHRCFL